MKVIVVVLCTFYLATFAVARQGDRLLPCLQNAGVAIADVPALLRDVSDDGLKKRGCIVACIMQNMGVMTGNVIDAQKITARFDMIPLKTEDMDELRQSVQTCVDNAADDDQCIVAKNYFNCSLEKAREYIGKMLPSASA